MAVKAAPQALMSDMLQQHRNPPSDIVNTGSLTLAVLLKSSIKSRPPYSFILLLCCCKKHNARLLTVDDIPEPKIESDSFQQPVAHHSLLCCSWFGGAALN